MSREIDTYDAEKAAEAAENHRLLTTRCSHGTVLADHCPTCEQESWTGWTTQACKNCHQAHQGCGTKIKGTRRYCCSSCCHPVTRG